MSVFLLVRGGVQRSGSLLHLCFIVRCAALSRLRCLLYCAPPLFGSPTCADSPVLAVPDVTVSGARLGNAVQGGAGGDGGDGNGNTANGGDFNSGDFSGNGGIAIGDNGNGGDGGDAIGGESGHYQASPSIAASTLPVADMTARRRLSFPAAE